MRVVVWVVCLSAACGGSGQVGDACTIDTECSGKTTFCNGDPFADGYCTADCSVDACPEGAICAAVGGFSICVRPCADRDGCRSGYQCVEGGCVPNCSATNPCGPGLRCDDTQACAPYDGEPVGAPCQGDGECSTRLCFLGACARPCTRDGVCAAGESCVLYLVGAQGEMPPSDRMVLACGPRRGTGAPGSACTSNSQCDRGACQLGVCVQLCATNPDCSTPGMQCNKMYAVLDTADAPEYTGCLPTRGILSATVPVQSVIPTPGLAQSMTIFTGAINLDLGTLVGIDVLTDPAGAEVYRSPMTTNEFYTMDVRYSPSYGSATMLIPNQPRVTLKPGPYFPAVFPGFTGVDTRVYWKLGAAPIASGNTSLNFYVTSMAGSCSPSFTASNGATILATAINTIKATFAQAGITITSVTFHATTAPNTVQSVDTLRTDSLSTVLQQATAGQPTTPGLDVVLVRSITDMGGGFSVLGIAGGIPSSPMLGTPHTGAVVSIGNLCDNSIGGSQAQFADVTAHEMGHTLGLFHNGEEDGHVDLLTDTASNDTMNLMWWLESTGNRISAQQGQVMRNDPKVLP